MAAHRIDVHHHFLPPEYVERVGPDLIGAQILSGKAPEWTPDLSLQAMDRNGIATAIVSLSTPGLWFGDNDDTVELCRDVNDYASKLVKDYPGRFGMFAALPLPDVDASLKEIAYALDTLKADGIGLLTSYGDRYPGEEAFAPVFDELNRRGAVVYFHPTRAPCSQCLPDIPGATLEFPFDTTRAIVSLLFGGTFARCRDIRWIFSHAGGTVPFLAERIGRLANVPRFKDAVPDGVVPELARLWYDTALSANWLAFRSLFELVAPEKVLFGSDYPFAPEPTMTGSIKALGEMGLDAGVLQGIERDHALKLFPQFGG